MSKLLSLVTCCVVLFALGCSQDSNPPAVNVDGAKYLLNAEPEGAKQVIQARQDAQEGQEVVVVGRIGGSKNPWIEDRAAFTIVDNSLQACSDKPGDMCKEPWDYCCETEKLPTSTALIKIVDENGKLVEADARKLLNVDELATVVVRGKAQRDDDGNLTVLANGVHVKK